MGYDHIVAGACAVRCVFANRLSADPVIWIILDTDDDWSTAVRAGRFTCRPTESDATCSHYDHEIGLSAEARRDHKLLAYARDWGARNYRPNSNCHMGLDGDAIRGGEYVTAAKGA